jgi:hypothetical protein
MRTAVCRHAYIGAFESNVSASLCGDPLRIGSKIVKAHPDGRPHSDDVSP